MPSSPAHGEQGEDISATGVSESITRGSVPERSGEGFLDSDKYTLLSFNAEDKISDPVALQMLAECSPPFPKTDDSEYVCNGCVPPNSGL